MSKHAEKARRTIQKTVRQKKKPVSTAGHTQNLSATMQIPMEAIFDEMPAERSSHIDITCPGKKPTRIALGTNETTIGRDDTCDVPLPLSNVSREHARISFNGEDFLVTDLESTNGTFVNNIRISRCVLRNNDVVRIGESKILFVRERLR